MDIKDAYLHGTVGVVKSINLKENTSVTLTYTLADVNNTTVEIPLPEATTDANGLLSKDDKTKIDRLKSAAYTESSDYAISKSLTNENLNDVITPGFYNAGGSNSVTNSPLTSGTHFGLLVIHGANGSYYVLLLYEAGYSDKVWRRHCQNGTWSTWILDSLTDTTYSVFTGATTSLAGTSGLVPAPTTNDSLKFLKGDGTWGTYSIVDKNGPGLAPLVSTSTTAVTDAYYVLASSNGQNTPSWYKLPNTAFNDDDTKVIQTNTTASSDYRILLSNSASDTLETAGSNKSANLIFNPYTRTLKTSNLLAVLLNLDGDIIINDGTNKDRYIKWQYNNSDLYGWRIGYKGSGSGNANLLTFESTKESTNTWTSALSFEHNTLNATFAAIVTATTFVGNLDGTYVNALTSYLKADSDSVSAITASDSLNLALGKLEYKADLGKTAYDWYKSVTGTDTDEYINKWEEIVEFLNSVKETDDGNPTDILDEFVTRKTDQTIIGLKTFECTSSSTQLLTKPLILKNSGWAVNMQTAVDFYTGSMKTVPTARIEDYMDGSGSSGGNLRFSTQLVSTTTNPNPNQLIERMCIKDDGEITFGTTSNNASLIVNGTILAGNITGTKLITSGGTSSQFVKGDGSLDSNTYSLSNHTHTNIVSLGYIPATTLAGNTAYPSGLSTHGFRYNADDWANDYKYPYSFGCAITAKSYDGAGTGVFLIVGQWNINLYSGHDDVPTGVSVRSRRDNMSNWTTWTHLLTNRNFSTYLNDTYLPLIGGTLSGALNFSNTTPITWNSGTYLLRIAIVDNSTSGDAVFKFEQSSDSGSTWTTLCSIYDTGVINGIITRVQGTDSTTDAYRNVWFSWAGTSDEDRRARSGNFLYNPTTDILKVGSITGTAGGLNTLASATNVTISVSSNDWVNIGNITTVEGTYAVQLTSGNLIASGIMSVDKDITDSFGDEIPLHVYGSETWRPYLRTSGKKILIASNDATATSRIFTLKVAKIL